MTEALIIDAVRTPFGKRKGAYTEMHPVDLATFPLRALVERNQFDPKEIEDVVMGCVSETGEQGMNVGRAAVMAAGWPIEVAGLALNRFCGSGQQAFNFAAMAVMSGQAELVIGAGVEHMTRVPMGSDMGRPSEQFSKNYPDLVPQGISAEMIAKKWGFTRTQCDEFAVRSQQLWKKAQDAGKYKKQIVPVNYTNRANVQIKLEVDEHPRPESTVETLSKLKPSFLPDGIFHAGNSSGIVDGAAAVLVASAAKAKELGLKPRARVVATAVVGSEPKIMLTGPIPATQKVLKRAGLKIGDMDVIEINEAFASVPLATMQDTGMDPAKVNIWGGAIAHGHPLGATGAALIAKLVDQLEDTGGRYGLSTMCIGFGMGIATIIERVN